MTIPGETCATSITIRKIPLATITTGQPGMTKKKTDRAS